MLFVLHFCRFILFSESWLDDSVNAQQTDLYSLHVDDERMSDCRQNFFLVLDMVDLFEFEHLRDGEHLECEVLLAWSVLDKNDPAECSCSYNADIHPILAIVFCTALLQYNIDTAALGT